MAEDPGWVPALAGFWRVLFLPASLIRTRRSKALPLLTTLRTSIVASLVSWLVLLDVLRYLNSERRPNNARMIALFLIGDGILNVVLVSRLPPRALVGNDNLTLAITYRAVFFIGWSLANSVVLFGFVGFFLTERLWIYALGLPFGLLCLAMITPTRARLAHDQGSLREAKSSLVLLDALMLPGGDIPTRPSKG
jgi:hypothetical protein